MIGPPLIEEIIRHCQAGRLVVIAGPPGAGKTHFLEHELKPALEAGQLWHVQVVDQFEDHLRLHTTGLVNPQIIALDDRALPQFERLEWQAMVLPFPRRDILPEVCQREGFEIEAGPLQALQACGVSNYMLVSGVKRLMDAERAQSSFVIRESTLESFGGADRLILESLDATIAELSPIHQELFFKWCALLISQDGRRLARTEKELCAYAGKLNRFALSGLPHMMELRLLRPLEMPDETRFEIARECLVPLAQDWWRRRELDMIAKRRAKFRTRSLSVAIGSIVTLYVVWILMTWKH